MTTAPAGARVEVAIVGGGLVGASLALALARVGRRAVLLEATQPGSGLPSWDERCIAINAASQMIFEGLGIWPALQAEAQPITATHISERGRFGMTRFTAEDAGLSALGYNVPVRHLLSCLWAAVRDAGIEVRAPVVVEGLQTGDDAARLSLSDGTTLETALVVAADGADSALRRRLGLGAQQHDYGQKAIVSAVRVQRPQPGWAYERFTSEGPVALLPKAEDACSLVWTLPTARAEAEMAADDATFMAHAAEVFGERLGRFLRVGRRQAWPLRLVTSDRLTAPRAVLIGNAAQSLHPVAAQGFNLGLRDVQSLAEVLAGPGDPGAADRLDAHAARRLDDRSRTTGFTDSLVRLFSNEVPGLAQTRHWGLLGLELLPPLKRAVMWQNLGYGARR